MVFFVCLLQYSEDFSSLLTGTGAVFLHVSCAWGLLSTLDHQIWHFLAALVLLSLPVLSFGSSTHADVVLRGVTLQLSDNLMSLKYSFSCLFTLDCFGCFGGWVCLFLFCSLQVRERSPAESTLSLACPVCVSARMLGLPPQELGRLALSSFAGQAAEQQTVTPMSQHFV